MISKPPKINKISLHYLPNISKDSYEIRVNKTDFDKTRHHIVIQVQLKNYDLDNDSVIVKLQTKPINSNPLLNQLQGNDDLRVKAFIYDFVAYDVIVSKLQEFKIDPLNLNYSPSDEMLNTAPVILAWDNRNLIAKFKKENKTNLLNEVKTIKILTDLEDGSANDGTRTGMQKGMIFGNKYAFKITGYTKEEPKRIDNIKWKIKYHNLTKMEWVEQPLDLNADKVTITFTTLEMCGRFVYLQAYMNDEKKPAELKLWMHNRFRWFDRITLEKEIEDRLQNPWKVNQSGTSLCGMACIFYLFAKEQKNEYKTFAKKLFRTGEATFNKLIVKPTIEILNKKLDKNGFPMNTENMHFIDFITLAGTRNSMNNGYKGEEGSADMAMAINWPNIMVDACENLLGYKDVKTKGAYNPIKPPVYTDIQIKQQIEDINNQLKNGYKLLLMIDSDLLQNIWDFKSLDLHWVALESKIDDQILMLDENGKTSYYLDFSVYTWGTNPMDNRDLVYNKTSKENEVNKERRFLYRPISKEHFISNYNGYIKLK